ncbi:MAG: 16S rRNA (guanine(966)-N(2))-methyltransferase RsmD [Gammaproteobacteria bacterium]|nr:16S rRNA (guanine(966)-N(2))-methyltransferase RsmD [Gammaproteobacteria bacterium]
MLDKRSGKLRIIGGRWRSRVLPVVDQQGLRPTPDRVRETLFNWLQAEVPGARCLDLFAGSGALGFEAASRGAAEVQLVEKQAAACDVLQSNIKLLGAENIQLDQQDVVHWLAMTGRQYDLVFVDPPYDAGLLAETCALLEKNQHLADEAFIYLECASNQNLPDLPQNWQIIRGKKAGKVGYYLALRQKQG